MEATSAPYRIFKPIVQAVCDMLLHQHLYSALLARHGGKALLRQHLPPAQPVAAQLEAALSCVQQWNHSCALCEPVQQQQQLLQRQPTAGACAVLPAGQSCLQLRSKAVADGPGLLQTLPTDPAQQPATQSAQAGLHPIPDSYVSRLLLSASRAQLQQVTRMTEQDWQTYFARLMPQLLLFLEMTSRHSKSQPASSTDEQPPSPSFYLLDPMLQLQHAQNNQAADAAPAAAVASTARPCSGACGCGALAAAPAQPRSTSALASLGAAAAMFDGSSHGSTQTVLEDVCAEGLPLGTCPMLDLAQLLQAVDNAMQVGALCCIQLQSWTACATVFCIKHKHAGSMYALVMYRCSLHTAYAAVFCIKHKHARTSCTLVLYRCSLVAAFATVFCVKHKHAGTTLGTQMSLKHHRLCLCHAVGASGAPAQPAAPPAGFCEQLQHGPHLHARHEPLASTDTAPAANRRAGDATDGLHGRVSSFMLDIAV